MSAAYQVMSRRGAALTVFAALLVVVSLLPVPAAGAEGSESSPFDQPIGWAFRWIQFVLVFGGGGYLIATKLPAFFKRRRARIFAAITEARALKEQAEKRLRGAEEQLARLDLELAEMREHAQRDWAAEAERIREAAREEAQKIDRAAQAEVAAAERATRMELKALAARLAVERAEGLIRQQMTAQAEAAILRGFVESLGKQGPGDVKSPLPTRSAS